MIRFPLVALVVVMASVSSSRAQETIPDSLVRPAASDSIGPSVASDTLLSTDSTAPPPPKPLFRSLPNRAFGVGESLVFDIAFKFVRAGTATMSIPDTQWVEGRPCYRIVSTTESSGFFSTFYRVRDKVESLMDIDGLFSRRFEKHIREGGYKSDRLMVFDVLNNRVFYKRDTVAIPLYAQDILAAFYFTRTLDLEVGKPVDLDHCGDGKVYPLRVLVHGREKVKVPAGEFSCLIIEPVLKGEGLFQQKGRLRIWVTDDNRKLPVLMKSEILVGSIDVRLKKIQSLGVIAP
jgi:hypothetical protein